MITEQINSNSDTRIVTIRSDVNGFEVTLKYNSNGKLEDQWVYERNKYYTTCSAQYDGEGKLKCKHLFFYDSNSFLERVYFLGSMNEVLLYYIYDNDAYGRDIFIKKYSAAGKLLYTVEKIWSEHECIKRIYRDSYGLEIKMPTDEDCEIVGYL